MNYLVTGLICSGKSTLLDVAKNYSFRTYKSDEIVSSLYQDEYIVNQLKNSVPDNPNINKLIPHIFQSTPNRSL